MKRAFVFCFAVLCQFSVQAYDDSTAVGVYTWGGLTDDSHSITITGFSGGTVLHGYWTAQGSGVDRTFSYHWGLGGDTSGFVVEVNNGALLGGTWASRPDPAATPTPTPTPSPTPTPDPGAVGNVLHGDIGDPPPDGFAGSVMVVFDDNGEVRFADVNSSDGTYDIEWLNSDEGRGYKQKLVIWPVDTEHPVGSHTDPVNVMDLPDGVVPAAHVPPPVVAAASPPPSTFQYQNIGNVISSSGQSSPVVAVSGGSAGTTVSAPGSSAPPVSITGSIQGSGAGGSFESGSGATESHSDLTDVKNLLREANVQREIARQQEVSALNDIAGAVSQSVAPAPTPGDLGPGAPSDNSNEVEGAAVRDKAEAVFTVAGELRDSLKTTLPPPPAISTDYGSTLILTFDLPAPLGTITLNCTPYESVITAFRNFLKFVLSVVGWIFIVKIFRGTFV